MRGGWLTGGAPSRSSPHRRPFLFCLHMDALVRAARTKGACIWEPASESQDPLSLLPSPLDFCSMSTQRV